jgi:1-acyl-sn-glycerol-3-phosphate acyltransferase
MIEVPLVYCLIRRNDVTGLVARKHYQNPFFRWIVNRMNGIWISRNEIDTSALRAARDQLKAGGVLGIAPEGTRSGTGALIKPKTGAAFLADQARVPIIPVGVSGTFQITKEILTLRRPRITVRFGEPFTLPPVDRSDREAELNRNTDEIMCRIAALIPPENRGVYADHPRALELLQADTNP